MIPKIVHYCWFSGEPMGEKITAYIKNWKQIMPDFDFRCCTSIEEVEDKPLFLQEAYRARKWAFVTDYMRCYLLYKYGGIYLDTDVQVLKNFTPLLSNVVFVGTEYIPTPWNTIEINPEVAIMGSIVHHTLFKEILDVYATRKFEIQPYKYDMTEMPKIVAPIFQKFGYKHEDSEQMLHDNVTIYNSSIFTNRFYPQENVYAVHQMGASWRPGGKMYRLLVQRLHLYRLYHYYFTLRKSLRNVLRK